MTDPWTPACPIRTNGQSAAPTGRPRASTPAREMLKGIGLPDDDLAGPLIGGHDEWSQETMPCNFNQRGWPSREWRCARSARPVRYAPMEFNTVSVSDGVSMETEGMGIACLAQVIAD